MFHVNKFFKSSHDFERDHSDSRSPSLSECCSSPSSLTPGNSPPPLPPPEQHRAPEKIKNHKRKKGAHLDDAPVDVQSDYSNSNLTKARIETCKGDDKALNVIECFLETDDLWKKFHELGTEMIITKSGRRMFPPLRVSFSGAKPNEKYMIAMDIVPTDCKRYRYAYHRSSWLVAGKADPPVQSRLFIHPDGPFTGESLYKQIISFEKVKLTNNEMDKCGHVFKF